jgi:hypothetical protein
MPLTSITLPLSPVPSVFLPFLLQPDSFIPNDGDWSLVLLASFFWLPPSGNETLSTPCLCRPTLSPLCPSRPPCSRSLPAYIASCLSLQFAQSAAHVAGCLSLQARPFLLVFLPPPSPLSLEMST